VEIKCQLDATEVFIADLIVFSTCFGHHYAHHQELKSIIQLVAACGILCCKNTKLFLHFYIFTAQNTTRSNQLYNTLELLMMGIVMPETC